MAVTLADPEQKWFPEVKFWTVLSAPQMRLGRWIPKNRSLKPILHLQTPPEISSVALSILDSVIPMIFIKDNSVQTKIYKKLEYRILFIHYHNFQ